jgi:S-adenosylmethionine:tRNA ribosyltransferase-isomerase
MKTADFDYNLPPELIAHAPADQRDHSKLLILGCANKTIEHKHFYEILDHLLPGDLLVLNNTKVLPANLIGTKEAFPDLSGEVRAGAKIEVLLVKRSSSLAEARHPEIWECLVKPGKRLNVGSRIIFGKGELIATVLEKTESGEQILKFDGDLFAYMHEHGGIPLPPYVKPSQAKNKLDERYQTVFAKNEGASAAPTAGLHFTPELLKRVEAKGVKVAFVTLHTGLATFKPVYAENVEDHKMYFEEFEVPASTFQALKAAKRVIAVGTTSVRTLEAVADLIEEKCYKNEGHKGQTNLFIYPGYKFKCVDALITNFHWPKTSLLMLVSAFVQNLLMKKDPKTDPDSGRKLMLRAYEEAIKNKYRFFSFGDAMLIE